MVITSPSLVVNDDAQWCRLQTARSGGGMHPSISRRRVCVCVWGGGYLKGDCSQFR